MAADRAERQVDHREGHLLDGVPRRTSEEATGEITHRLVERAIELRQGLHEPRRVRVVQQILPAERYEQPGVVAMRAREIVDRQRGVQRGALGGCVPRCCEEPSLRAPYCPHPKL